MTPVMLDTDILSEYLRGNPRVVSKVEEYLNEFDFVSLSIITYYEILNGLLYKDAKKQLKSFNAFVDLCKVIPFTLKTAKITATIQADLRKKGTSNWSYRYLNSCNCYCK